MLTPLALRSAARSSRGASASLLGRSWTNPTATNTTVQRTFAITAHSNNYPTITSATTHRRFSTAAVPTSAYDDHTADFPSLVIRADAVEPHGGAFADVTAQYLQPDEVAVDALVDLMQRTQTGIVAHYYMDVELQGILQAVAQRLPGRVGIADSLRMGDLAVEMAQATDHHPVQAVLCLGVDFMAESVQAILQRNGHANVPVYRADARKIGCSLAESAEQEVYRAWLQKEGAADKALHVVYINTSLETKAVSSSIVPTITCTSSNVLPTILQAAAQVGPDLKLLYGPDTYMGNNLERLLEVLSTEWTDERIAAELHPQHTRASLRQLRDRLTVFPSGNCVVHHMFGHAVVDAVRQKYDDCYVTAHLEVPGEMFDIAMAKSLTDDGVVGSTSNILQFIARKVQERASSSDSSETQRLRFILGTEAGMVTSIVQSVQNILQDANNANASRIEAEIIFPVASDAVSASDSDGALPLVPGVPGGEGCSTAGGCATCPFMKMNHIDAVMDVLAMVEKEHQGGNSINGSLARHLPPDRLRGKQINGRDAMDLGVEAILYMRQFMKNKRLPDELYQKIVRQG